ncbi:hypothetical protein DFJ58DRAFT_849571 [Suillus subalutaceus]|uniref:uncharacterized protein n=1 Tax=Suillus subalutaceus TaxID=48586 RepID=UPI001B860974|nr:uncharacterized protein DFJ58DRAFT_849571 [Suillus subalutaceus]KAG1825328.1 hypothetical protein DFJ58DRAFT_849571 [Suillus subalutaceus]
MKERPLKCDGCAKAQEEKRSEREVPRERTKADNDNHWKHKVCPSGDYYFKVKPNREGSTAKGSNNDEVRCNACYKPRGKGYDVPMRALKHEKVHKVHVWECCALCGKVPAPMARFAGKLRVMW